MIDDISQFVILPQLDLDLRQKNIVTAILAHYLPTATIWVFGSRVGGGARVTSDLDLVILPRETIPKDRLLEMKEAFDQSDLDIKVDVTTFQDLPPSFQSYIKNHHFVIQA